MRRCMYQASTCTTGAAKSCAAPRGGDAAEASALPTRRGAGKLEEGAAIKPVRYKGGCCVCGFGCISQVFNRSDGAGGRRQVVVGASELRGLGGALERSGGGLQGTGAWQGKGACEEAALALPPPAPPPQGALHAPGPPR